MNIPKLLEMTDEQFIEWASKQLAPKPWKHELINDEAVLGEGGAEDVICKRCLKKHSYKMWQESCSVSPLKLDWNTAKEWQGKCRKSEFIEAISKVSDIVLKDIGFYEDWILLDVEPRHYLIATVLCLGE